jgi:hypothetical protein
MGEAAPPFEELGYFRTCRQLQVELNEGEPRQVTSSSAPEQYAAKPDQRTSNWNYFDLTHTS